MSALALTSCTLFQKLWSGLEVPNEKHFCHLELLHDWGFLLGTQAHKPNGVGPSTGNS